MQSTAHNVVSDYIMLSTQSDDVDLTQEQIDQFWETPSSQKTPEQIFGAEVYIRMTRIIAANIEYIRKQVKVRKLNISAAYQLCKDRIGYYDMPFIGMEESQSLTTEQRARANSVALILREIYGEECEKYFQRGLLKKREIEKQKMMTTITTTGNGKSIMDAIDLSLIDELSEEDVEIVLQRLEMEDKLSRQNRPPVHAGGKINPNNQETDYHRFKQQWMMGSRVFKDWAEGLREAFIILGITKYLTMSLEDIKRDVKAPRTTDSVRQKMGYAQQIVRERFGISLQLI